MNIEYRLTLRFFRQNNHQLPFIQSVSTKPCLYKAPSINSRVLGLGSWVFHNWVVKGFILLFYLLLNMSIISQGTSRLFGSLRGANMKGKYFQQYLFQLCFQVVLGLLYACIKYLRLMGKVRAYTELFEACVINFSLRNTSYTRYCI